MTIAGPPKKDYPAQPGPQLCHAPDRSRYPGLLEVQKRPDHHSILTAARHTHLTDTTNARANVVINTLMDGFVIA